MRKYRINYLLKEDYHYSYIDNVQTAQDAADVVSGYFDDDDDYTFLSSEEVTVPGPREGDEAGLSSMIINSISDEWNTISNYHSFAITARSIGREDIAKVIDDIIEEENVHVGQLQEILKTVAPATSQIESGEEEAQSQLEGNEETDDAEEE